MVPAMDSNTLIWIYVYITVLVGTDPRIKAMANHFHYII